jgi:hypothetical protein
MNQPFEAAGLPRNDLRDLEKKAFRYDTQDGITEFLAGVLFIFAGRAAVDPHLTWMLALLLVAMRFALRFFKTRFTYPRAGYVKVKSEPGRELGRGMLLFLGVILFTGAAAIWIFGDIRSWRLWMKWLPALLGGFTSGGFIYLAGKTGLVRHYVLVGVCLGWGVVCSLMEVSESYQGIHRWTLGLGVVCLVMGLVVFLRFLRTHPVRQAEDSHDQA